MTDQITGIILAGGKNSRIGVNKAFLKIGGKRLIDAILETYGTLFDDIAIVTHDPISYLEFSDAVIVTDIYKNKGPLGGLYTGLFYAKHPHAFICPCDMPYLNRDFIAYMIEKSVKYDVTVPITHEGLHQPLHAVYSKNCLPSIKRLLLLNKLKVTGFYRDMRILTIPPEQIQPFNQDGRLFLNINTPDDVKELDNFVTQPVQRA